MADLDLAAPKRLPRAPGLKIIRRDDAANWTDGYRFLEEARASAEALLQDAKRAYEDAKTRGFDEGHREGMAAAASLVTETAAKVDSYLASIERDLAELSLTVVEQVIGRLPDAEVMVRAAAKALESFRREKQLVLRVSPEIVEDMKAAAARWAGEAGPLVLVEPDARLQPLHCTIVSDFAVVDVGLDAQLAAMRRSLAVAAESDA